MSDARDRRPSGIAIPASAALASPDLDARTEHAGAHRIPGPAVCARILLLGECNPLSVDPRYALYHQPANCSGHRLQQKILGLRPHQMYLPIWRTNLCFDGWDPDAARTRARDLLLGDGADGHPWRTIVALGVKVAEAIRGVTGIRLEFLSDPIRIDPRGRIVSLISLPHPSGRNQHWNDAGRVRAARVILGRAASDVPWGEVDAVDVGHRVSRTDFSR